MSSNVSIFVLQNGTEIVAESQMVVVDNIRVFVLTNPQIVPKTSAMKFVPWLQFAKNNKVPVPADMVLTNVEPDDALLQAYTTEFCRVIQVPSDKIILQ